jgi:hypothetical protein
VGDQGHGAVRAATAAAGGAGGRDEEGATEAEATQWAEQQRRHVLRDGEPAADALTRYLASRTDLAASSVQTLGHRLRAVLVDRPHVPVQAFPWRRAWDQHVATTAKDTQIGVLAALRAFIEWLRAQQLVAPKVLDGIKPKGRRRRGKRRPVH